MQQHRNRSRKNKRIRIKGWNNYKKQDMKGENLMEKEANFFIVCYDTGTDYHYEFDPENPDNDNPKDYDYVPVTADTMREALEKAADEMQQQKGKIYPIDFESTMKNNVSLKNWKDIVEYINEKNVDIDFSEILKELSKDPDEFVRRIVAGNENTPVSVLEALAKDEEPGVRLLVTGNENTPVSVLEGLAKDEDWCVRQAVAENENTPRNVLEYLAKDKHWKVCCAVAENKNTPVATLEILAKDPDENVRCAVAENENTPATVLEKLAKDNDPGVLISLIRNENTPVAVLESLAKDPDESVRDQAIDRLDAKICCAVAEKENAPMKVPENLSKDEKPIISASDLKEAKAEKDVRDAAAPKQEQKQKAQEHGLE